MIKTIRVKERVKIEAPGCLISIYPDLENLERKRVCVITVRADRYEDDRWFIPDFGTDFVSVRVVKE